MSKTKARFITRDTSRGKSQGRAKPRTKANLPSPFPSAPSLTTEPHFPELWTVILDDLIPAYVKDRFSPQDSWKKKPFSQDDVVFFSKGLLELSDFFTEDREGAKLPNYFTTAKFRSSYFLYFFGLQGAKFLTLFDRYPKAVDAALKHGKETGLLRIVDVGSGPGTASIAFLIHVLEKFKDTKKLPFEVQLVWIDRNKTVLEDGEEFLHTVFERFADYDGAIDLVTEPRDWWKHGDDFNFDASIVLFGNVINESSHDPRIYSQGLKPFIDDPKGAGVLIVEPAFKSASQRISQIRDELMPMPIWGPCLHTEKCPLSNGRDWCHFSVPAKLPGQFFRKFSIKLGGIRDWLKFSFLWIAAKESENEAKVADPSLVRVISDPMRTPRGLQNQICLPETIGWADQKGLQRGDVIRYSEKRNDSILQPRFKTGRDRKDIR